MNPWNPIQKPAQVAEARLLEAILSGHFAVNSDLPGERDLAAQIGVTRPTLREAMQRLARDGWLDIQHGKPTRVRDYWQEGNLGVLSMLAQMPSKQTPDFVAHLLEIRVLLAPTYTRQALEQAAPEIAARLVNYADLEESPSSFAGADWELHFLLTQRATNPIFRLLLNSFQDLYQIMGERYFASAESRKRSLTYYAELLNCAKKGASLKAETLTRAVMEESLMLWKKSSQPIIVKRTKPSS
ncbi:MAG: fatty acid metabolism transcriptional regulator FadR [Chloroflexi bacterium]|nr:MAG: fatty acid metabolism transcriptional regulator FadR [Chloroflexota bacterium]